MQPLPQLQSCLELCFEARDREHASGIRLSSYFVRAPTRGRRRSELTRELLFPQSIAAQLGRHAPGAIELALDPASWRSCLAPRPTEPVATREWLAEASLSLGKAEGVAPMWSLLHTMSELEHVAQDLLGRRTPRAVIRQVLNGVGPRALRAEPFAALLVRVLKIAQSVYAAFRHAGLPHGDAWAGVEDRLWAQHPTGSLTPAGTEVRGAYLPSLVQAASGNARRKLRRSSAEHRTGEYAQALLARFSSGTLQRLWPWRDAEGRTLPLGEELAPQLAAIAFFVLLTHTASERRERGGPAGGLWEPFALAGFGAAEWLPDRTDDVALRLFCAGDGPARPDLLQALSTLLREAQKAAEPEKRARSAKTAADQTVAQQRLPELLRWLEENARELLETS